MSSFYLRDTRTNVGSSCTFWAKDGCGYTSDLGKAEVYSLEDAQRHFNSRHTDVPLSKDLVDAVARTRVDHQYLDESKAGLVAGCNEYVIHVKGDWDGNDVYWKTTSGSSVNLSEALVLKKAEAKEAVRLFDDVIIYSMPYVMSISRHTLQVGMIIERCMITAAGIRKPKRRRQRLTTGRTRGNCPHCGKVTWGLNPYEAYTCAEAAGEKHGATWMTPARKPLCFLRGLHDHPRAKPEAPRSHRRSPDDLPPDGRRGGLSSRQWLRADVAWPD